MENESGEDDKNDAGTATDSPISTQLEQNEMLSLDTEALSKAFLQRLDEFKNVVQFFVLFFVLFFWYFCFCFILYTSVCVFLANQSNKKKHLFFFLFWSFLRKTMKPMKEKLKIIAMLLKWTMKVAKMTKMTQELQQIRQFRRRKAQTKRVKILQ